MTFVLILTGVIVGVLLTVGAFLIWAGLSWPRH